MPRIDGHVHILPPRVRAHMAEVSTTEPWFARCHAGAAQAASERDVLEMLDAHGIERAVCFTWPFEDPALCAEANDWLAEVVRAAPARLVGFGIVNPRSPGAVAEAERCARLGLRGLGELNADAQGWSLDGDDPAIRGLAERSAQLGLPWNLHCSEPVGHVYPGKGTSTPDRVAALAERHPDLRLVCAHLGGGLPLYAHMPEVRVLCQRLWFDTAAMPFLYKPSVLRAVLDLVGAERVIFGSDYPLLGPRRYLEAMRVAGLRDDEREMVMGGAMAALLGE